jgi:FeS assembly SUF system regulator
MIRMNKLTDYGIVLLTHLAREGDSPIHSARDLAESSHLPAPTVNKLLKKLSQARLLTSQRGVNGGYTLARDPAQISVAEAISALEGPIAITECSSSVTGLCSLEKICPNRSGWRNISQAIRATLENLSLHDIAHPTIGLTLNDPAHGRGVVSSNKALGAP